MLVEELIRNIDIEYPIDVEVYDLEDGYVSYFTYVRDVDLEYGDRLVANWKIKATGSPTIYPLSLRITLAKEQ